MSEQPIGQLERLDVQNPDGRIDLSELYSGIESLKDKEGGIQVLAEEMRDKENKLAPSAEEALKEGFQFVSRKVEATREVGVQLNDTEKAILLLCGKFYLNQSNLSLDNQELLIASVIGNGEVRESTKLENQDEKEQINDMLNSFRGELKNFSDIEGFNPNEVINTLRKALESIMLNSNIPSEVKDKFVLDFNSSIKGISNIDKNKIDDLRIIRENMSLGLEEKKSDGYYLSKIINQGLVDRIGLKASSIERCFVEETLDIDGTTYHKENITKYHNKLTELDKKYGFNIGETFGVGGENFSMDQITLVNTLAQKLNRLLEENDDKLLNEDGSHIVWLDIRSEYMEAYNDFFEGQTSNFIELKEDILDEGTYEKREGIVEDITGMEKIDEVDIENKFSEKLSSKSTTDLVICLNQICGLIPGIGATQDGTEAFLGVSTEGEIHGPAMRTFLGACAILDISGIGTILAKGAKAVRLTKVLETVNTIIDLLPNRIAKGDLGEDELKVLRELAPSFPKLADALKLTPTPSSAGGGDSIGDARKIVNETFGRHDYLADKPNHPLNVEANDLRTEQLRAMERLLETASPELRANLFKQQFSDFIDTLVTSAEGAKIPLEEARKIAETAKASMDRIIDNPAFSTDSLKVIADVKEAITSNLSGSNLRSLTHILEAVETSASIPHNPRIANFLENNFPGVSQTDLMTQVAVFHDLIKNTLPTQVVQFIPGIDNFAILKGGQLSSHQLESANYLRGFANQPDSQIYKAIAGFLDAKGIKTSETTKFMETMAKTIEGHAGNTEFIQVDTARGMNNLLQNIAGEFNGIEGLIQTKQKAGDFLSSLVDKGQISADKMNEILAMTKEAGNPAEAVEVVQKSLAREYLLNNVGKDIPFDELNLSELKGLCDVLSKQADRRADIGRLLDSGEVSREAITDIVGDKVDLLRANETLINKYLHTRGLPDEAMEAMRYDFNMNDVVGYGDPKSEGFTKLIFFNSLPELISSPMNSTLSVITELRIRFEKTGEAIYDQMANRAMDNVISLQNAYNEKLASPLGEAPDYIQALGGNTFGEAYEGAQKLPKDHPDNPKILSYFQNQFKDMCANTKTVSIYPEGAEAMKGMDSAVARGMDNVADSVVNVTSARRFDSAGGDYSHVFNEVDKALETIKPGQRPPEDLVRMIAGIDDNMVRMEVAKRLLGRNVSTELADKLLRVHEAGENGVYNLNRQDLRAKIDVSNTLELIGDGPNQITKQERKMLMDFGVLGKTDKNSIGVSSADFAGEYGKVRLGRSNIDNDSGVGLTRYDGTRDFGARVFDLDGGGKGYAVGTGDRVVASYNEGERIIMGSEKFVSCAASCIVGKTKDGKKIMIMGHIEEGDDIGQYERLKSDLRKLHEEYDFLELDIYVNIDPMSQKGSRIPENFDIEDHPQGFYNSFPESSEAMTNEISELLDIKVNSKIDLAEIGEDAFPKMRDISMDEGGIKVEYEDRSKETIWKNKGEKYTIAEIKELTKADYEVALETRKYLLKDHDIVSDYPGYTYLSTRLDKYVNQYVHNEWRREYNMDYGSFRCDGDGSKALANLETTLKDAEQRRFLPFSLEENPEFYEILRHSISEGNYLRALLTLDNPNADTIKSITNLVERLGLKGNATINNLTPDVLSQMKNELLHLRIADESFKNTIELRGVNESWRESLMIINSADSIKDLNRIDKGFFDTNKRIVPDHPIKYLDTEYSISVIKTDEGYRVNPWSSIEGDVAFRGLPELGGLKNRDVFLLKGDDPIVLIKELLRNMSQLNGVEVPGDEIIFDQRNWKQ